MLKHLLRRPATQALLASLLGRYLDFALRTTRWTLLGGDSLKPFLSGQPAVFALWHERLPLMPALLQRVRNEGNTVRICALASRHADGRVLGTIMGRFGVDVVHGSTARNGQDRGGSIGLRALLDRIAGGEHVVLTPDGPRGPRRHAAPGVAQLAGLGAAPVLACAAQTSRRFLLASWDRMVVPLPWGRGTIVCGAPISVPREEWEAALPRIEQALTEAAEMADRCCR